MDLGLLEVDDSDAIPEGAVVIARGGEPENVAPAAPVVRPPPVALGCTEEPSAPEPLIRMEVEYPPGMAGIAGRVLAKALVSAEGIVTGVEILASLDPAIDQAVKQSLARWRFRPAQRCQKAVPGSWTLALRFEQSE